MLSLKSSLALVLPLVLAACSSSSSGGNPVQSTSDAGTGGDASTHCTADVDCESDQSCDTTTGKCVTVTGCQGNADCNAQETCNTKTSTCVFSGCAKNGDCAQGETCDTATGVCMGSALITRSCHECACEDLVAVGGCAEECTGNDAGGAPNFCDGKSALSNCALCLADKCGNLASPPVPTNPAACM
jgi:hypothetical protein